MLVLGIETSCDETAASLCHLPENSCGWGVPRILSNVVASQEELHGPFGGVVPEIASRAHAELISEIIERAVEGKADLQNVDCVGVTYGPGLIGALLVGVAAAKALCIGIDADLVAVNHLEAHIYSTFLAIKDLRPPVITLLVSGGHTMLVLMEAFGKYLVLGETVDDACGEAFDKVARVLELGYPGGPIIEKTAKEGDSQSVCFPRAMLNREGYDFSFSGLKTAVANHVRGTRQLGRSRKAEDVAASFQLAVADVLCARVVCAMREFGIPSVAIVGGVAANGYLRERIAEAVNAAGGSFYYPGLEYCTDNAAMVAATAAVKRAGGVVSSLEIEAEPSLRLNGKA